MKNKITAVLPLLIVGTLVVFSNNALRDYYGGYESVPDWIRYFFWIVMILLLAITVPPFVSSISKYNKKTDNDDKNKS